MTRNEAKTYLFGWRHSRNPCPREELPPFLAYCLAAVEGRA